MSLAALIIFALSLTLIILLFVLKSLESKRLARIGESWRSRADIGALKVKWWLEMGEQYVEHVPSYAAALSRYVVHVGALSFARLARLSAEQAHHLADFVSHKRNFERRETKSQFLKQVGEYKNGSSDDTTGQL